MNKKLVMIIVIVAMAATGCRKPQEAAVSVTKVREENGIPVKVAAATIKSITDRIHVSGTVLAPDEVNLTPQVGGEVVAIYKNKGDAVKKGEALLQIKKDDYENGYKQAKAAYDMAVQQLAMAKAGARPEELEQASNMADQAEAGYDMLKKTYKRTKELYDKGVASRQQLDAVETELVSAEKQFDSAKKQLEVATTGGRPEEIKMLEAQVNLRKAAMDSAQLMLERTTVRSPVDGVISYRLFNPGESVGQSNAIYQILKSGEKKIAFTINESQLNRVKDGAEVVFTASGVEGVTFKAKISYVSNFVRKMTREAEIEAVVVDEPALLAHGMFVEGDIVLPDIQAFVIPQKALLENMYVMVVKDNVSNVRECKNTERIAEYVWIKDDCLKQGDMVVVEGQGILDSDVKVQVKETLQI